MATTFSQPQIRALGLARANVPKDTAECGIFEIVMVTKNLGCLGACVTALIATYLTSASSRGECISRGMLRYLGCLGLFLGHQSESLFLLPPLIKNWEF